MESALEPSKKAELAALEAKRAALAARTAKTMPMSRSRTPMGSLGASNHRLPSFKSYEYEYLDDLHRPLPGLYRGARSGSMTDLRLAAAVYRNPAQPITTTTVQGLEADLAGNHNNTIYSRFLILRNEMEQVHWSASNHVSTGTACSHQKCFFELTFRTPSIISPFLFSGPSIRSGFGPSIPLRQYSMLDVDSLDPLCRGRAYDFLIGSTGNMSQQQVQHLLPLRARSALGRSTNRTTPQPLLTGRYLGIIWMW